MRNEPSVAQKYYLEAMKQGMGESLLALIGGGTGATASAEQEGLLKAGLFGGVAGLSFCWRRGTRGGLLALLLFGGEGAKAARGVRPSPAFCTQPRAPVGAKRAPTGGPAA